MKTAKFYLNSSKEDMLCEMEEKLGIDSESKAADKLQYALYEVGFELEVNEETGEYKILKVMEKGTTLHSEERIKEAILETGDVSKITAHFILESLSK